MKTVRINEDKSGPGQDEIRARSGPDLGQNILRTNQKRTNEVRDGLGGTYVYISMNEDRAH